MFAHLQVTPLDPVMLDTGLLPVLPDVVPERFSAEQFGADISHTGLVTDNATSHTFQSVA